MQSGVKHLGVLKGDKILVSSSVLLKYRKKLQLSLLHMILNYKVLLTDCNYIIRWGKNPEPNVRNGFF